MDSTNMYIERSYLKNIRQQIEMDEALDFIEGLKILLVSDDAWGRAIGLLSYILEKTGVQHVELVTNYFDAKKYVKNLKGIDILIYVGHQEEIDNYRIIDLVKEYKHDVLINMYAYLDNFIYKECNKYDIFFTFHCDKPIRQFLITLQSYYIISQSFTTNTVLPKKHNPLKAIRSLFG